MVAHTQEPRRNEPRDSLCAKHSKVLVQFLRYANLYKYFHKGQLLLYISVSFTKDIADTFS